MDLVLYGALGVMVIGAVLMVGLVVLSLFEDWWKQL